MTFFDFFRLTIAWKNLSILIQTELLSIMSSKEEFVFSIICKKKLYIKVVYLILKEHFWPV